MTAHKVPQDVEADDKLIGFLSMKQFIFVVVAMLLSFAAFQFARINIILMVPFLPFIVVFATLGLYQRKDQPVEVYLLAMLGFYLKPHRRIWNQDGILEAVKITVPKKVETHFTDGLTKIEVKSRLNRLSTLMDTRGWATKNAEYQTNVVIPGAVTSSDRLINPASVMTAQPSEIHASDDIMDINNNPTAQNFDAMMTQATKHVHDDALAYMQTASTSLKPQPTTPATATQTPHYNPKPASMHQKIIAPVSDQSYSQNTTSAPTPGSELPASNSLNTSTMTPPTSDAILKLANRRDDNLSVETIAKEAERLQSLDSDKTIKLH